MRLRGAKLSAGKLRSLLPIYEERAVDRDLLEEGSRDLASYFQSQGYFDATSTTRRPSPANGEQLIDYHVDLGVRHKIVKLEIQGNHYFDDATIRERMSVIPATFVRYRHGRYSRNALERDLDAIRDLYRANGFRDVEVTSRELDDYNGATATSPSSSTSTKGPSGLCPSLHFEGVSDDVRAALLLLLHSTAGQPYSDLNIATDRDNILDYYFNNGYPAAKFDFTSAPAAQANRVDLKFIVTPGERVYVRDVLVAGLKRTQPDLVTDRISLHAGDPLSQSKINGSQRRLYDLGIFARVDAAIQNPDGDEPTKYVLYSLEEAGRYSMNVGVGAEIGRIGGGTTSLDSPAGVTGFSPRFLVRHQPAEFLRIGTHHQPADAGLHSGTARPAHLCRAAVRGQSQAEPAVLRIVRPFSRRSYLLLAARGRFRSIGTKVVERRHAAIPLHLSQGQYSWNSADQSRSDSAALATGARRILFHELHPGQPRRSDRLASRHLHQHRPGAGLAAHLDPRPVSGAWWRAIPPTISSPRTWCWREPRDFGLIERYAGLPRNPAGRKILRRRRLLQPRVSRISRPARAILSTGFPIGGNALFMNTVELRFPLIGDNLGGVLFNDMGNVYSAVNKISLRFRQPNLQDFDYAVQGFGFGIRYRTPLGPVRVDFSLSPNSPRFFGCEGSMNQLYQCGVTGSAVLRPFNASTFSNSISRWGRRSDETRFRTQNSASRTSDSDSVLLPSFLVCRLYSASLRYSFPPKSSTAS